MGDALYRGASCPRKPAHVCQQRLLFPHQARQFLPALLGTVGFATVLPCNGHAAELVGDVTALAIGLLFFLHGAKLPREAIIAGITHWRLYLTLLCLSFVLCPVLA